MMRLADILRRGGAPFALAALAAGVLYAADDPAPKAAAAKSGPAKLETLPGGGARVILTEKAAQRLGIETGQVSEAPIVRKQVVGGLVVAASQVRQPDAKPPQRFGGFALPVANAEPPAKTPPAAQHGDEIWVLVSLSRAEWERLAKDKPARLLPLATREAPAKQLMARPSGMAPVEDGRRSMLNVYYISKAEAGTSLEPNTRMRVELQLAGSDETRRVVPYSSVLYDAKGGAWVYVNPQPLVFDRQAIRVERVVGELAVLADGPASGTKVVTVGAPLLYGVEVYKK